MRIKRHAVIWAAILWSSQASADCADLGDGRAACLGQIQLLTSNSTQLVIGQYGDTAVTLPCTLPNGWWTVKRTHPMYREWYAFLLAATASKATLWVVSKSHASPGERCEVEELEIRN